jgi:hypothetical protein
MDRQQLDDPQRDDLAVGDFLANVREEIGASRAALPDLLLPATLMHHKVETIANALVAGDLETLRATALGLAALAARVSIDGARAFPFIGSPAGESPARRQRTADVIFESPDCRGHSRRRAAG